MNIEVACFHCRAGHAFEVGQPLQFGFELAILAAEVGMQAYSDGRYGRLLIFCNKECADAERTKTGLFRRVARGVEIDQREHA